MDSATKKIIRVSDLNLYYGKNHTLKDINLDISPKTVTAFIGPSGCGKSTFLRCFNRMNDFIPSAKISGKVTIDDEDIYSPKVDVINLRKRVGMVFQKPNPFPMSIYDNIAFGPRLHGTKDKDILDHIVETSLKSGALWDEVKDKLQSTAKGLSGGQQQRMCIARTIATEPEIVLMDEPTSALDPMATAKIEELCRQLRERYTVVIVTHNMQQAARISDETAFFLMGDLVESGPTERIFTSPAHKKTGDYITGRFG